MKTSSLEVWVRPECTSALKALPQTQNKFSLPQSENKLNAIILKEKSREK